MKKEKNLKTTSTIYFMGFFFAFSVAIPTYITSTFLNNFAPEKLVGIIYTISAILTIFVFIKITRLLTEIGNYGTTLLFFLLDIAILLIMAFSTNPLFVIPAFVLHLILINILIFNLDIFLENLSKDKDTGGIRGTYLSSMNVAWLISPLVAGFILTDHDYWKVFLLASILLLPTIFLLAKNFRDFKDPKYEKADFFKTLHLLKERKNVYRILINNLILKFFYSWMVIYTPIYLHEHIGFDWKIIGIMFAFMLLPFVLFEIPLGKLADKKIGEKEILNLGFIIMAITTASLSFITSTNPITWALLLFATRVGASMVEVSTETYFFKKITSRDANILSLFRMTNSFAYIFSPILASFLLFFISFNYLFVVMGGIILILGLYYGLKIKDTK